MNKHSRRPRRNPSRGGPEVTEQFTGKVQTKYGGAGLLRRFVRKLGLPGRLAKLGEAKSGLPRYLLCVLSGLLLGLVRQCELADLRAGPAALLALGLDQMPSQPALSRFFAGGTRQLGRKLLGIEPTAKVVGVVSIRSQRPPRDFGLWSALPQSRWRPMQLALEG